MRRTFGDDVGLGRPPLLQACRAAHLPAITAIVQAGATARAKDALGFDAAALALAGGGVAGVGHLVEQGRAHGQKLPLGDDIVRGLWHDPAALWRITAQASLTAVARALLLCDACAALDQDAVAAQLAGGTDPNKALRRDAHVVHEACTSARFWLHELPGWALLCQGLARTRGVPGASSVTVDPGEGSIPVIRNLIDSDRASGS